MLRKSFLRSCYGQWVCFVCSFSFRRWLYQVAETRLLSTWTFENELRTNYCPALRLLKSIYLSPIHTEWLIMSLPCNYLTWLLSCLPFEGDCWDDDCWGWFGDEDQQMFQRSAFIGANSPVSVVFSDCWTTLWKFYLCISSTSMSWQRKPKEFQLSSMHLKVSLLITAYSYVPDPKMARHSRTSREFYAFARPHPTHV